MPERHLDFDKTINRRGTDSLKYDFAAERGLPDDVLPFWVADMDFRTSSYITDALIQKSHEGIFGYSEVKYEYFRAVSDWMKWHHNWNVSQEWLIKTPGVVFALAAAVRAYTDPGDAVLIQQPVYYPFSEVIEDNNRVVVSNDLYLGDDNRYHIDLDDFEKKITSCHIRLFLLCNPHNPTGRAFTREELTSMGNICLKHGVIVVSDEIHEDFVFVGEHTVFATIDPAFSDISVTCTSASKTFNLASMMISNIFIPNEKLRHQFKKAVDAAGISQLSLLGLTATRAAYEHGQCWYQALTSYLKRNIRYVRNYVKKNLPGVTVINQEATYLMWLDFRGTGLGTQELEHRIVYDAKLWFDSGKVFGEAGKGFERINIATSSVNLAECMERLKVYVVKN